MENTEVQNEDMWRDMEKSHRRGKVMGGLLLVTAGGLYLAREAGAQLPEWLFTWKMLLIAIGIVMAVKHKFRHPSWIFLIGVGTVFILNDYYPDWHIKPYLLPLFLIIAGLFVIFKPRRKRYFMRRRHWRHMQRQGYCAPGFAKDDVTSAKEDYIDSTAFFASVKKNILSKKFKGGEANTVFGGTEINLMQADMEEKATLELTQVFGGVELIVPSNWEIKSELVTVFGGVEDKRPVQPDINRGPTKLLVLTGTTFFGGIEIKSF